MDGHNIQLYSIIKTLFISQTNYVEQHPLFLTAETSSLVPTTMVSPLGKDVAGGLSTVSRVFLLTTLYIWVSTSMKALSTFKDSRAEVSMKYIFSFSANSLASSVDTARKCRRSALFPTSMTTAYASVWSRSSFNHLSTFSNVNCRVTSYTTKAPTAPR